MKVLGYAIKNAKNGFCLSEDGFFCVNASAAEYAKLCKTYADAEKVSNSYRCKDIPTYIIEVVKEY